MKGIVVGGAVAFAIAALFCGTIAAWYWNRSSRVAPAPLAVLFGFAEPARVHLVRGRPIAGPLEAFAEAGRLNSIAARWTACSVMFGCFAMLASML